MKISFQARYALSFFCLFVLAVFSGCTNDPSSAANGPSVENPAAAAPNSVVPVVGGPSGNGGGVTGGGAGAGIGH